MVVEIGLVHPPVGMNVYIINRLAKDVPLTETFKGVVPFLLSDVVRIALLRVLSRHLAVSRPYVQAREPNRRSQHEDSRNRSQPSQPPALAARVRRRRPPRRTSR